MKQSKLSIVALLVVATVIFTSCVSTYPYGYRTYPAQPRVSLIIGTPGYPVYRDVYGFYFRTPEGYYYRRGYDNRYYLDRAYLNRVNYDRHEYNEWREHDGRRHRR